MTRPVTLFTGHAADLSSEEVCAKASPTRIEPPAASFDSAFSSSP